MDMRPKSTYSLKSLLRKMYISDLIGKGEKDRRKSNEESSSSVKPERQPRERESRDSRRPQPQRQSRDGGSGGSENKRELENLNREFARDIVRLEQSICAMEFREKSTATEWIAKLRGSGAKSTLNEARARNYILNYLLKCIDENVFNREPFSRPPPPSSLASIKAAMPLTKNTLCMAPNEQDKQKYLNELYNESYDNGDFLSQLPVPRDGAFFVLHLRPNM